MPMDCMLATRNGNESDSGQVILCLNLTQPAGLLLDLNPARLINGFFFSPQTRPIKPPRALSHHARPKIRFIIFRPKITNTNYKHTNLRFIIFRPKITNANTNPNTNTNINTNHKHKFQIYDL